MVSTPTLVILVIYFEFMVNFIANSSLVVKGSEKYCLKAAAFE